MHESCQEPASFVQAAQEDITLDFLARCSRKGYQSRQSTTISLHAMCKVEDQRPASGSSGCCDALTAQQRVHAPALVRTRWVRSCVQGRLQLQLRVGPAGKPLNDQAALQWGRIACTSIQRTNLRLSEQSAGCKMKALGFQGHCSHAQQQQRLHDRQYGNKKQAYHCRAGDVHARIWPVGVWRVGYVWQGRCRCGRCTAT